MAKQNKNQKSKTALIEEEILSFWESKDVFKKSLKKNKSSKKRFVFYEGPPTANGRPGIHHVLARSFKDLFLRYKTMQGYYAERRAGWDTHGLPVELEVEKKLGFNSKQEIEKYGVKRFNKKCKESVWQYKDEWERITKRIGFWLDLDHPYITYDPNYIESLWWIISEFYKKGFLEEDYKVSPYCTRCGTVLSSHELAQGYENVKDNSVYVKFELLHEEKKEKEYFLVWTTTPWTLPANVALAVNKDLLYVKVKYNDEIFILAKDRVKDVLGDDFEILEELKGEGLVGVRYKQLIDFVSPSKDAFFVVSANFVSAEDGTGIVHIAPAYGEDDMHTAKTHNLPVVEVVKEDGTYIPEIHLWQNLFVKKADPKIIEFLKEEGKLFKEELFLHEYPFCWRCKTPLIYFAKKSWFVKTSKVNKELIANNQKINWIPEHIKNGRFGEWLKEKKDWAFSRSRYWATPLPVWRCEKCLHTEVIGSLSELKKKSKLKNSYFLMRHGEALFNVKNKVASKDFKENKLTKKGEKQAKEAAKKIKDVDLIIASPFLRTKQTAKIVANELGLKKKDLIFDPLLEEINTGEFNGRSADEYHAFFNGGKPPKTKKEYFNSLILKFNKRPKGGENLKDLRKRVKRVLNKYEKKYAGKKILIVTHEYVLWMFDAVLNGWTDEYAAKKKTAKLEYFNTAEVKRAPNYKLPTDDFGYLDLHRPYVDEVLIECKNCKTKMKRVSDVCDVWFDSGAMPFAQFHYPFENRGKIDKGEYYPSDYICEAVDQTRGWFYTLLAVATLLGFDAPYKNVISLGHILDAHGKKMSKSKGNIVSPWEMSDKYGIDSVRWYFYIANSPGEPKKFNERDVLNYQRKHVLALMNIYNFLSSYTDAKLKDKFNLKSKNILDRWIIERLKQTILKTTGYLDAYNPQFAARVIAEFVDDLTNWYIRRSRRRFQYKELGEKDYEHAKETLLYVFSELLKLSAPFTPFITDYLWLKLKAKNSIHLSDYPKLKSKKINQDIIDLMQRVREVSSEALKIRAQNKIKVRQPLSKMFVGDRAFLDSQISLVLREEVNVKEVVLDDKLGKNDVKLDLVITQELKEEGMLRELIRHIQEERKNKNLTKNDKIIITFKEDESNKEFIEKYQNEIKSETLAQAIIFSDSVSDEKNINVGDVSFAFSIKKFS